MLELTILLNAMKKAGEEIEAIRQQGYTISLKQNHTLVTEADLAADRILKETLLEAFPQDGWLSEETADDYKRLRTKRVWIVDPIDGTKEFLKNLPEYAISVALVENHLPMLAAIYNPVTKELFHAIKGQGAWCNGCKIQCDESQTSKLQLLASRTEFAAGRWDVFKEKHHIRQTGSIAYKLALIAKGEAHATFSLTPKSEWDIAAGTLLVQEADGIVTALDGSSFLFNQKDTRVNGIIASNAACYQQLFSLVSA